MELALTLGRRGQGRVWPNPAVGCVIVRAGRVVGRGWTQPGGRPHAEVVALAQAGAAARGATVYVTLEPCAHHGQTPPCAQALIKSGVARVVAAIEDSDPRVSGQGIAMLRSAGIEVEVGVCKTTAARDLLGFFLKTDHGRPMLTLKLALSLDGRIATKTGDSQWITGPIARRRVHALRSSHDAILIGGGTARSDDPSLTVRGLGVSHQPIRIVASAGLNVPHLNLFKTARDTPVWLCHLGKAPQGKTADWTKAGATLIECRGTQSIDVDNMLQALGSRGLTRVFCEGGGQLAASLMKADLVDRLIVHSAGVAIGGDGLSGLGSMGHDLLMKAGRWDRLGIRALGGDVETEWIKAG